MQIQLKQGEITAALKAYIQSQGFNLEGKEIEIQYTAGRKESGLYADIFINEVPPIIEEAPAPQVLTRKAKEMTAEPEVVTVAVPLEEPAVEQTKTTSLFAG